jgi:hypothetical protein
MDVAITKSVRGVFSFRFVFFSFLSAVPMACHPQCWRLQLFSSYTRSTTAILCNIYICNIYNIYSVLIPSQNIRIC